VPQPYVYAPLLAALVLWTMLTAVDRDAEAAARTSADDSARISGQTRAISAA
jgi:hypothetical protein